MGLVAAAEYLVDEILERDSISTEGCGEDIEDSY